MRSLIVRDLIPRIALTALLLGIALAANVRTLVAS